MYIFKNAFLNIVRSKGRNFLIGVIVFVIAVSSCISLSIKHASDTAQAAGLKNLKVTASISLDRFTLMQKARNEGQDIRQIMSQYQNLSLGELQKYAKSKDVSGFYYRMISSMNGNDNLSPVDATGTASSSTNSSNTTNNNNANSNQPMPDRGGFQNRGDFSLIGYSSYDGMTAFVNGTSKVTSGKMFDIDKADNSCIISDELAVLNNIKVGDSITLENLSVATETYTLTVTGIYKNTSTDTQTQGMRFGNANEPANQIYTSVKTMDSILKKSENVKTTTTDQDGNEVSTAINGQVSGTYVLADKDAFTAFQKDVESMGLPKYYTVSSADLTNFENSLVPIKNLSNFATIFLMIVLIIGGIILFVLNIFNIRERKYEVGVLTAIGMKKWKVAIQFVSELLFVTLVSVFIGTGVGAVASVPVANHLLSSQIKAEQQTSQQLADNFGSKSGNMFGGDNSNGNRFGGFQFNRAGNVNYISYINAVTDISIIFELIVIGLLLTVLASFAAIIFIMRYEPLKILNNRA